MILFADEGARVAARAKGVAQRARMHSPTGGFQSGGDRVHFRGLATQGHCAAEHDGVALDIGPRTEMHASSTERVV